MMLLDSSVQWLRALLGLYAATNSQAADFGQQSIGIQPQRNHVPSLYHTPNCPGFISCPPPSDPYPDTCCLNSPGGHFLLTQFWDTHTKYPASHPGSAYLNHTWTIHGLWPDHCKGGFDAFCNKQRSRSPQQIRSIVERASRPAQNETDIEAGIGTHPGLYKYMSENWLSNDHDDANLWQHEFNKHGTCISTLEPKCYLRDTAPEDPSRDDLNHVPGDVDVLDFATHTVMLNNNLPTFVFLEQHGIVPSHTESYSLDHIQQAIRDSSHKFVPTLRCRNGNELAEIWYHYSVRGSLRGAWEDWMGNHQYQRWYPVDPDTDATNCPRQGIKYLPKRTPNQEQIPYPSHTKVPHASSTTFARPRPTQSSGHSSFQGAGRLMVKIVGKSYVSDNEDEDQIVTLDDTWRLTGYNGCLIRNGKWYAARSISSCATYTVSDDVKTEQDGDDVHLFTLGSRSAPCSFIPRSADEENKQRTEIFDSLDHGDNAQAATYAELQAYFECRDNLRFQSIMAANVSSEDESERKLLLLGKKGKGGVGRDNEFESLFYAPRAPRRNHQETIWSFEEEKSDVAAGGVLVQVYWEAV